MRFIEFTMIIQTPTFLVLNGKDICSVAVTLQRARLRQNPPIFEGELPK